MNSDPQPAQSDSSVIGERQLAMMRRGKVTDYAGNQPNHEDPTIRPEDLKVINPIKSAHPS